MIYLTGQLIIFLLVTAFVGFVMGWLLRGAMLPLSTLNSADMLYHTESKHDKPNYLFGSLVSDKASTNENG